MRAERLGRLSSVAATGGGAAGVARIKEQLPDRLNLTPVLGEKTAPRATESSPPLLPQWRSAQLTDAARACLSSADSVERLSIRGYVRHFTRHPGCIATCATTKLAGERDTGSSKGQPTQSNSAAAQAVQTWPGRQVQPKARRASPCAHAPVCPKRHVGPAGGRSLPPPLAPWHCPCAPLSSVWTDRTRL